MKKTILAVFAVSFLSVGVWAACIGPFCYDDNGAAVTGGANLSSSVNVAVTTPTVSGLVIVDSNFRMYVSTCTTGVACWTKPRLQQ